MDLSKLRERYRASLPDVVWTLRNLVREHSPEAYAQREAGYLILDKASDEATVRIYDEIWWLGVNASDFVADLDAITAPKIRVELNSPGGSVFDGITIYNALRSHPAFITTRVDGLAASIASVIAQAGDKRIMQPSAQLMIHNAHGVTMGDNRDHAEMVDLLKQQDDVIASIYADRSGRDIAGFKALMDAETWMTADRAIAEGLADEIIASAPKQDPDDSNRRTLLDQISETMAVVTETITSAETVASVRAAAGKDLSNVNRESLIGLRDAIGKLDDLLTPPTPGDIDVWTADEIAARRAALDAHT